MAIRAEQPSLALPEPPPGNRGGGSYDRSMDFDRLNTQAADVWRVLAKDSRRWHTLASLSRATGHPEASVSARLRDFRKPEFGGHEIETVRQGNVFLYRLKIRRPVELSPC